MTDIALQVDQTRTGWRCPLCGEQWNSHTTYCVGCPGKRPDRIDYTAKVDALLAHCGALGFTEVDFAHLCLAAADQSGLPLGKRQGIARILELPLPEEK